MRTGRNIMLLIVLTLAICLSLLEAGSAVIYYWRISQAERETLSQYLAQGRFGSSTTALKFQGHPYSNFMARPEWRGPDGARWHNSEGWRSPEIGKEKPAGTWRLAFLGGSTTYDVNAPDLESTWPMRVGKLLSAPPATAAVQVINAATPSYTTAESLITFMLRVVEYHPDVVLIHHAINDGYARWYPDEGGPDYTKFRFPWRFSPPGAATIFFLDHSYCYRLWFFYRGGALQPPGDLATYMQYPLPPESELEAHAAAASGKYFRRNLLSLAAVCRAHGAWPVLSTMPLHPQLKLRTDAVFRTGVKGLEENNQIIREVARELGVPLIDLAARPARAEDFTDIVHVTAEGSRRRAEIVAEELRKILTGR